MRISDWSSDVSSSGLQQIKKTPIVVNDSRGFFTSRVFSGFTDEGDRLLKEGVNPIIIENLARQIGMPVGPLAVQDEVMMDMLLRRSEEHTSELQSLMRISYAVFCLKKKIKYNPRTNNSSHLYYYNPTSI